LRGFFDSLSPSEKRVAQVVLDNPEDVTRMTLAEIAERARVSGTTAIRFCRSIGYASWLEFRIELTRTLPHSSQLIHKDIAAEDSVHTIFHKVIQGGVQALESTRAVLDPTAAERAVDLLLAARTILIVGVGTSGPIANEMFNRLLRLGLDCKVQTDSYLQVMQLALMTPQDVLVVISQTGESSDPYRTAEAAAHMGIPYICITGNSLSPLARNASVVLLSVSQESMPETLSSRIAQYALVHALYISMALRMMDQTIENERQIWDTLIRKIPYQHGGG
jgi:DNA-binding MurR/RpiR family transcriptional regulator